jgi:hypothetical protein
MTDQTNFFTTYDLNLSAVLVAKGCRLEKTERQSNGKALFYFTEGKKLSSVVDLYWKDEIKISPQKLFNSLKAIKNRLYSGRE